jgi:hypothetical protein
MQYPYFRPPLGRLTVFRKDSTARIGPARATWGTVAELLVEVRGTPVLAWRGGGCLSRSADPDAREERNNDRAKRHALGDPDGRGQGAEIGEGAFSDEAPRGEGDAVQERGAGRFCVDDATR